MSYQRERDEFIKIAVEEGLPLDVARKLLRYARTLHRLATAQCNGDWPADNGERDVIFCPKCEGGFVASSFRRSSELPCECGKPCKEFAMICPDCRTTELVIALLKDTKCHAVFNGDPRGAVLKLEVPSGRTNDWGREGVCVPVRDR